jgi:hypothetical protein
MANMRFGKLVYCAFLSVIYAMPSAPVVAAQNAPARATALIDCVGGTHVRPAEVVFACADANISAQHLVWTGWGETFAAAVGEMEVNSCTPSCVAGTFHAFKVVLVARGAQRCPNGVVAYDTVTYAFPERSPFPPQKSGPYNSTVSYRCGKR